MVQTCIYNKKSRKTDFPIRCLPNRDSTNLNTIYLRLISDTDHELTTHVQWDIQGFLANSNQLAWTLR